MDKKMRPMSKVNREYIAMHESYMSHHFNAKPPSKFMRRLHMAACSLHRSAYCAYKENMDSADWLGDIALKMTNFIETGEKERKKTIIGE